MKKYLLLFCTVLAFAACNIPERDSYEPFHLDDLAPREITIPAEGGAFTITGSYSQGEIYVNKGTAGDRLVFDCNEETGILFQEYEYCSITTKNCKKKDSYWAYSDLPAEIVVFENKSSDSREIVIYLTPNSSFYTSDYVVITQLGRK